MWPITKIPSKYNVHAKKDNRHRGFTIVELIVVIAVIGILAAVVLVSYGSWQKSVATASVKSDLQHAASAMESSRSFDNTYSATLPTTFTSSSGNTMALTVTSATSFCIDGTSSNSATIQYYIDNVTQATGPTIGTCATRTSALLPGIPAGLTVSPTSTISLSLTWTASSNTVSYTAQCATDTAFIVGIQSAAVTAPTITAVVTGLSFTTSYYCRVNATNASGTSTWSATVGPTTTLTPNGGVVATLAGSGVGGFADGTSTAAQFYLPEGVAVDSAGTIYVADTNNNSIRKITPAGVVTTLAGSGVSGSANGTGTVARFNVPNGIAVDSAGTVYVADTGNNSIRKITPAGVVTTLAGSGATGSYADGTGTAARFNNPSGVAVDSAGTIYVADTNNNSIRKITPAGVVTTLAGSGAFAFADGTGTAAQFYLPSGLVVDSAGTIYVADTTNNRIRKITPAGVVTTLAGSGVSGSANGTGTAAQFKSPAGVALDSSGVVYVVEYGGNRIRKITPAGVVTTLAGSGAPGSANGTGTAAQFYYPSGIAVDSAGVIYVADNNSNLIRIIR